MTKPKVPPTMTVRAAAELLGVSTQRIYQLIESGKLPCGPLGRPLVAAVDQRRASLPPKGTP